MSSPSPLELTLLLPAARALAASAAKSDEVSQGVRLELLEAVASRLGGWDLREYRELFGGPCLIGVDEAIGESTSVLQALAATQIPTSLALCSLARPILSAHAERVDGVYYTDFRLATYLAKHLAPHLTPESPVIDPASGTGILLVATVLAVCGDDRVDRARMLSSSICAADLSATALRGARLALASLTEDLGAVAALDRRMRVQDSLIEGAEGWSDVAPAGFACVIGNPPWEKVKVSRHEFLRAAGIDRHYGEDYASPASSAGAIQAERQKAARYALMLTEKYPLAGSGETDLYKAFFELSIRLASPDGRVALLVPAGLIRSQGTQRLRHFLWKRSAEVDIAILENRARFFPIDTRFKFLAVHVGLQGHNHRRITLRHADGTEGGVEDWGVAHIGRRQLEEIRPDLTIPEVRNDGEWRLFRRLSMEGVPLGGSEGWWQPKIVREVDMTRDRKGFSRRPDEDSLPLIEGRMVHQFRFGPKSYKSGTGRRAMWEPNPLGRSETQPQFWIAVEDLPLSARGRVELVRVGFCDVTGQTNERTILATRVPMGVVCGNKVPTITFAGPAGDDPTALALWLAVANSFVFDWLARRVTTTTINFFLLRSLPFPALQAGGLPARRLAALGKDVMDLDRAGPLDPWVLAEKRAEIDARVVSAYQLTVEDLALVLNDFPLLDRRQPPLEGEARSTVTRDLVMTRAAELLGEAAQPWADRVERGRAAGAVPYVPAQYLQTGDDPERKEQSPAVAGVRKRGPSDPWQA